MFTKRTIRTLALILVLWGTFDSLLASHISYSSLIAINESELATDDPRSPVLIETIKLVASQCPIRVDEYTQLVSVIYRIDNTIHFKYEIIGLSDEELKLVDFDEFKKETKNKLINLIKTSPESKEYQTYKVKGEVYYSDERGNFIFKIVVLPQDYL